MFSFGKMAVAIPSIYIVYDYCKDPSASIHIIIGKALRQIDPEQSHSWSVKLSSMFTIKPNTVKIPCTILGHVIDSPIGIAAGYSKNGEAISTLENIGFGIIEIGSITPCPQEGNDKPRVFRLEDIEAIINRYGFNSDGHSIVASRLQNKTTNESKLFGINLGKNKYPQVSAADDYIQGLKRFSNLADYMVINISSPNTPGLRALQGKQQLSDLFKSIKPHAKIPILLKVAPDLHDSDILDICDTIKENTFIKGLIISNTTISRPINHHNSSELGGLSGKPLYPLMKSTLSKFCTELKEDIKSKQLVIIGCGGISTSDQILELGRMGCSAVQLYTSLVYNGIGLIHQLNTELKDKLGSQKWDDIVGSHL